LRQEVSERLGQARRQHRRQQREQALLDQLRDRYPLQLPEQVVQHEAEEMAREWARDLARQGVDVERAPIDWQALFADLQPRAERRVHSRLLLDAAAAQHGIELPPDELEQALGEIGRLEGKPAAQVRRRLADSGNLERLEAQLKRRALLDRLLGEENDTQPDDAAGDDEETGRC
jgi:trigger factor